MTDELLKQADDLEKRVRSAARRKDTVWSLPGIPSIYYFDAIKLISDLFKNNKELSTKVREQEWQPIENYVDSNHRFLIKGKNKNGFTRIDLAFYTKGGEVEFRDEGLLFPECYNEDTEESYLPEGWWVDAINYNGDYDNMYVKPDYPITHFKPIQE